MLILSLVYVYLGSVWFFTQLLFSYYLRKDCMNSAHIVQITKICLLKSRFLNEISQITIFALLKALHAGTIIYFSLEWINHPQTMVSLKCQKLRTLLVIVDLECASKYMTRVLTHSIKVSSFGNLE